MFIDILGRIKQSDVETNMYLLRQLVLRFRQIADEEGISPTEFPDWLAAQGITASKDGIITVDDKLQVYASLIAK